MLTSVTAVNQPWALLLDKMGLKIRRSQPGEILKLAVVDAGSALVLFWSGSAFFVHCSIGKNSRIVLSELKKLLSI